LCVVVFMDSGIDRKWGARASLALAKAWTTAGRRVILLDACMDRPELHRAAGVPNLRGASDMVLSEATIQDILVDVGDGLLLAPPERQFPQLPKYSPRSVGTHSFIGVGRSGPHSSFTCLPRHPAPMHWSNERRGSWCSPRHPGRPKASSGESRSP
jgi:hypothetical protein